MTTTVDTATDAEWGNPGLKTFKKRYIRNVKTPMGNTWVHNEVADIVREIFLNATLPLGDVPGYLSPDELQREGSPRSYGVVLGLPWADEYRAWGFADYDGAGIVFTGSIDEARSLSELALSLQAARQADAEEPSDLGDWKSLRPGTRNLTLGDKGDDVQFIQLFLGIGPDGIYGPETAGAVEFFRRRLNTVPSADVDGDLWRAILPKASRFSLSRGDGGLKVRVLQAALAAYDWAPIDSVTGTFGVDTSRAVRRLQATANLRVNGSVRSPEWAYLLGSSTLAEAPLSLAS